jgi:enoyl-CoA hydratase/carnithine racemase
MRLKIKKHSAAYWQVTIDNPPINVFDKELIAALKELMDELETNEDIKVLVFDSANPDFFIAHIDLVRATEFDLTPSPRGFAPWPDIARRFELAPFVTIAVVRGRARAVGSEFLQSMDMRFASKEKAKLAQIEVGFGLIPGGGGLERLPYLTGRARAMEIIIGADDFDADTAALYGWINRSIPDAELDAFVDRLAKRIASFERNAIAATKKVIYERVGLATAKDFKQTETTFFEAIAMPSTQKRIMELFERGLQQPGAFELNISEELGPQ